MLIHLRQAEAAYNKYKAKINFDAQRGNESKEVALRTVRANTSVDNISELRQCLETITISAIRKRTIIGITKVFFTHNLLYRDHREI